MRREALRLCASAAEMPSRSPSKDKPKIMEIKTVGVIGGGTMGNGIAHVAARSGLKVILHDVAQQQLDNAVATISRNLDREVAKNKITADDKSAALARILAANNAGALAEADFIIEAVIEDI